MMTAERAQIRIDFVSDVVCPWCAIGLRSLEIALARLGDEVEASLHLQPFELNPDMPPEGEDIVGHLSAKYRITHAQIAANGEMIRARGVELGFDFRMERRTRTYNTFDAHRLLHWAELQGKGLALKHALLRAYFTDGENVADHALLARHAAEVGLPDQEARELLKSDRYATEVRVQERFFTDLGIRGVPAVILNYRHLVQGGQPPEMFERALRNVAGLQRNPA
jgi:predicted DsbA family dithiol-disulfide isomerase